MRDRNHWNEEEGISNQIGQQLGTEDGATLSSYRNHSSYRNQY
jgi:hypothetical protein